MSLRRDIPIHVLHMGCGERLIARVPLAWRYLPKFPSAVGSRRGRNQAAEGRR